MPFNSNPSPELLRATEAERLATHAMRTMTKVQFAPIRAAVNAGNVELVLKLLRGRNESSG